MVLVLRKQPHIEMGYILNIKLTNKHSSGDIKITAKKISLFNNYEIDLILEKNQVEKISNNIINEMKTFQPKNSYKTS